MSRVSYNLFDEIIIFDVAATGTDYFRLAPVTSVMISDEIEKKFIKFLFENPTFIDDAISIRVIY